VDIHALKLLGMPISEIARRTDHDSDRNHDRYRKTIRAFLPAHRTTERTDIQNKHTVTNSPVSARVTVPAGGPEIRQLVGQVFCSGVSISL
jgi:hypothetical protein